jgi:hypothetical protein
MLKWLILIAIVLLSACGSAAGTPSTGLVQIDQVDVRIAESFPPQVFVQFQGTLGDGCTSLGEISQRRDGNSIEVTVATNHSGAEVCTAIAQLIDQTISLDGDFPPGAYSVRVNGVVKQFQI